MRRTVFLSRIAFTAATTTALVSLCTAALAATKVGVVGAANPLILVVSEEGIERELLAGDVIFLNDTIKTSESGAAQLMFLDRTALTIAPNAEIKIDQFVFDPATQDGEMKLNVASGAFRLIGGANSKKKPIEVKTPISTIGIRGSIMDGTVSSGSVTGTFVSGNEMTMQDANGNSVSTSTPGSGVHFSDGMAQPEIQTPQQMSQRFPQSPVRVAFNVAPSSPVQQIEQINQQMNMNSPAQPTPSATTPQQTPASQTPQSTPQETTPQQPTQEGAQLPNDSPPTAGTTSESATPETTTQETTAEETPSTQTQQQPAADSAPSSSAQGSTENAGNAPATDSPSAAASGSGTLKTPVITAPLSQTELTEVQNNPASVLDKFPKGGPAMTKFVTKAIAANPALAEDFSNLAQNTNPQQASSLQAGMSNASRMWNRVDPAVSQQIRQQVTNLNNPIPRDNSFRQVDTTPPENRPRPIPRPISTNLPQNTGAATGSTYPFSNNGTTGSSSGRYSDGGSHGSAKSFSPIGSGTFGTGNNASSERSSAANAAFTSSVSTFVAADANDNKAKPTSPSK